MNNFNSSYLIKNAKELSIDQLRDAAPSIFAETPDLSKVSNKYAFIPTTRVLNTLGNDGWKPVFATQSRSRTEGGEEFTKHLIRFRNDLVPVQVGEFFPEIVLTNSHNGLGSYCLDAGLFRLACSNGLIVSSGCFGSIRIKHIGYADDQVIEASARVIESIPLITNRVKEFQALTLNREEQLALATAALTLRYDSIEDSPVKPEQLLQAKRYSDSASSSLWNTFNTVQENIVRGGVRYRKETRNADGVLTDIRRNSTRAIASVNENVKVNRALWTLTEELAKIKKGEVSLAS